VSDLSGLRKAIEDAEEDKDRQKLVTWLSSIDPSTYYNSARAKHEPTTGDWLIVNNKEFRAWENSPDSFLWLNGKGEINAYIRKLTNNTNE